MLKLNGGVTDQSRFFENADPFLLTQEYGSPLYVYNERILRGACRELLSMCGYPSFSIHYSVKANSNLTLLRIIHEEGLRADAMSPGEIRIELEAGFPPDEIFFVPNNVSEEEMRFALEKGITTSVDSLSQLERYGRINPGGQIAIRFNPGIGAGHHEKVITAGKNTKFGVNPEIISEVHGILKKYRLQCVGVNQHIGSLFLTDGAYLQSCEELLTIAKQFDDLAFVDLGGGFGIPYRKQEEEPRLDLKSAGAKMDLLMYAFSREYGKDVQFRIEPGRYVTAECGVLLGTVHALKNNGPVKYVGTDIGQSVLARPVLYNAHHDIEVYRREGVVSDPKLDPELNQKETVTIVGNICESGDILAKNRVLPAIREGDLLGVLDAGAYGYAMSSNYNNRLRPAEILLRENSGVELIRRRDTFEDFLRNY
ncbi:MAG: diaminopimelate decarboxylase [Clostridiales bacterium]|jgi:diaminopimelate decarboxylase|nr:diaminopimelate decarboxylase [Clostridiales bacterium]